MAPTIKIVHIYPPAVVQTDSANFRSVVQTLTGSTKASRQRKRSRCSSDTTHERPIIGTEDNSEFDLHMEDFAKDLTEGTDRQPFCVETSSPVLGWNSCISEWDVYKQALGDDESALSASTPLKKRKASSWELENVSIERIVPQCKEEAGASAVSLGMDSELFSLEPLLETIQASAIEDLCEPLPPLEQLPSMEYEFYCTSSVWVVSTIYDGVNEMCDGVGEMENCLFTTL